MYSTVNTGKSLSSYSHCYLKESAARKTFQHCAQRNLRDLNQYTEAVRLVGLNSEPMLEAFEVAAMVTMFCQTPVKTLLQAH